MTLDIDQAVMPVYAAHYKIACSACMHACRHALTAHAEEFLLWVVEFVAAESKCDGGPAMLHIVYLTWANSPGMTVPATC